MRGNHEEKRSDSEAVAMAEGRANSLRAGATIMAVRIIQSYLQKKADGSCREKSRLFTFPTLPSPLPFIFDCFCPFKVPDLPGSETLPPPSNPLAPPTPSEDASRCQEAELKPAPRPASLGLLSEDVEETWLRPEVSVTKLYYHNPIKCVRGLMSCGKRPGRKVDEGLAVVAVGFGARKAPQSR